jgi:hypothetical protein
MKLSKEIETTNPDYPTTSTHDSFAKKLVKGVLVVAGAALITTGCSKKSDDKKEETSPGDKAKVTKPVDKSKVNPPMDIGNKKIKNTPRPPRLGGVAHRRVEPPVKPGTKKDPSKDVKKPPTPPNKPHLRGKVAAPRLPKKPVKPTPKK